MKTALKWIATLAGLAVAMAIAILLLVNPNDFKPQIERAVMQQSGRQLRIEGNIGLSLFPWLGLQLGAVQLSNPPGFSGGPFMRIKSARVHVRLLPLLRKRLEVDAVVLQGLRLNLLRNKAGTGNWTGLVKPGGKPEAKKTAAAASALSETPALEIGSVSVTDAEAGYQDLATGARYQLRNLKLTTGVLRPARPVDIQLAFDLSSSQPALGGHVEFTGTATLDPSAQQYRLSDAQLQVKLRGNALPGGKLDGHLSSRIEADMKAHTLEITGLVLQVAGLRLKGEVYGKQLVEKPRFSGQLWLATFNPRSLMTRLGLTPPATSDPDALKHMKLNTSFTASTSQVALDKLQLVLDETRVEGRLNVNYQARTATRFALNVDTIDLDRYLPPPVQHTVRPVHEKTPSSESLPIPVDALRTLNLAGSLDIKRLKAGRLNSHDVRLEFNARDGRIRLYPATARLYEGQYSGDLRLNLSGPEPRLSVNQHLAGIQASPLLKDLTGNDRLAGTGNVNIRFTTHGMSINELLADLNGQADIAFTNGAIRGVNIAQLIRQAQAMLKGKQAPPEGVNQTDFSALTASATITNGVLNNQDLRLKSPLLRISGAGKIDLPQEKINYLLRAKISDTLEGQGGRELAELSGLTIPIRISGDLYSPSYRPELASVFKNKLKATAKKKIRQQEKRLRKKLENKLRKQFRLPF